MIIQVHGNLCFLGLQSRCFCFLKVVTSMGCVLLLARSWWKLACNQILSNSRTKARSAKLSKRVFVVFVFISTSRAIFVYTNPLQTCKFMLQTPSFCIILIFFWRKPLLFQRFYLPLPPKSLPMWGWEQFNNIDGTRPQAICTASLERTFSKRYCLYVQTSQLWNYLQRWCNRSVCVGWFYIFLRQSFPLFIYNKVYAQK